MSDSDHESAAERERIFPGDSEMAHRMRAFEWSGTDLGRPETWPQNLRIALGICLSSRFPLHVWWGPNLTLFYNDASISFLGRTKHPAVLGRSGREAWAGIWDTIGPMIETVLATGTANWSQDILMCFDRELPREEVYVTFSFSPVFGAAGTVEGLFCACTETTEKIIGNRRLDTLRKLGVEAAEARTVAAACRSAAQVLGENPRDLPLAAVYSVDQAGRQADLRAWVGIAPGGWQLPSWVSCAEGGDCEPLPLARVVRTRCAADSADLGALGIRLTAAPWPEPVRTAVVLPIRAAAHDSLAGLLVVGVSPRRPLDASYRAFLDLVAGHLGTALANARAYEEERRRAEAPAELDRTKTVFLSNVGHEFRTPLTLLLGPLEEELRERPEGRARLQMVHRSGLRLLKLVNTLLGFARIEAGRSEAVYEPTELAAYTAELASEFRSAVEKAGLRLAVQCPTLPEPVYVDREMWEKIVLNLLSNAFKFTFEGEIGVALRWSGERVELTVSDTGTAVQEELRRSRDELEVRVRERTEALRESEARLAAELSAMSRLYDLSTRLPVCADLGSALEEVLDAAIVLHGADMGNVQLYDPQRQVLEIVASRGFEQDFLDHFREVKAEEGSACGRTLKRAERVVIEDVRTESGYQPLRQVAARAGYRAVQSTPLCSRSGELLGVVSTHFRRPHRPSDRDLRMLDLYSRMASAFIERVRAEEAQRAEVEERRRTEAALRESEERFRLMIQTVQDYAIFLMDPAGNIASWNEGGQRLLGYPAAEVVGRPGALFFTEEDRLNGMFERELETAAAQGRATDENWLVRKDGSRFWASGATTALRGKDGRPRGFAKIFRDLTERKAAEAALQEKELRLRVALSAARMGTWHWDVRADRQVLDESLQRLMGAGPDHAVNTLEEFLGLIHPEDRAAVRAAFTRSVEQGVSLAAEFRVVWPDGSVHWLKDQGDVFPGPDGRPLYLTGACMDITDHKAIEEELREADRRKDEFLAMLSHELRNPLAPIRNGAYILERAAPGSEQAKRARQVIDRQAQHMTRLIEDLLDVTRISRGKITLHRERVDLNALARGTAEDHREVFSNNGVNLVVVDAGQPLYVDGDPTRLVQVIGNLLNNAAKFTPRGGHATLTVEATAGGEAIVRVRDTGVGLAPDTRQQLFEPFMQADRTLERSQGGLGLGLALVKGLVGMHGGQVDVHSEGLGKGAEFTIALPLQAPARPSPAVVPAPPPGATGRRVLVVEDNPMLAESLRMVLEIGGHQVAVAYSGPEGLEVARTFAPEVVLCDLGLPGMDGYGVAKAMRADPALRPACLVALSGYALQEDVQRSREAGFDRHMAKPADLEALEKLLAEVPARAMAG